MKIKIAHSSISLARWAGILSVAALPVAVNAQSSLPTPRTPPRVLPPQTQVAVNAQSSLPTPATTQQGETPNFGAGLAPVASTLPSGAPLNQPAPQNGFLWVERGADPSNPFGASSKPSPAVVLNFGKLTPEHQGQLGEDLEVMSFLIEKKLDQTLGSMPTIRMGIPMLVRGGSPPVQSMFVEGYGAIFLVHVNFPLVGPSEPPKTAADKPKNSEWDAVRNQLEGRSVDPEEAEKSARDYQQSLYRTEYSAERVESVTERLLQALKNASNIRGLGPEDYVVISIRGKNSGTAFNTTFTPTYTGNGAGFGGGYPGMGSAPVGGGGRVAVLWQNDSAQESFLSIRVKKSDIDAFASGEMKFDDFKAKALKAVYRGAQKLATK